MIRRVSLAGLICAGLCFSVPLRAQTGTTGSVVNGHVVVQVFVTLSDEQTPFHPVAGLPLGFLRSPRDTAIALTDKSGSAIILLAPGTYRVVSLTPAQWKGSRYSWSTPIVVAESMRPIDLREKDAVVKRGGMVTTVSDGETMNRPSPAPVAAKAAPVASTPIASAPVAAAPVAAPAPPPASAPAPAAMQTVAAVRPAAKNDAPRLPAARGRSTSSGLFIGLGAEGDGLKGTAAGSPTESGSGAGLVLGYGFNRRWALYGDFSGAVMNATGGGTYQLAHADVGIRAHFRSGHMLVPFLELGADGRGISAIANGATVNGTGVGGSIGAGLNTYLTRSVALSSAVTWSGGTFNNFRVDSLSVVNGASVDAMTARLHLGLVWFP